MFAVSTRVPLKTISKRLHKFSNSQQQHWKATRTHELEQEQEQEHIPQRLQLYWYTRCHQRGFAVGPCCQLGQFVADQHEVPALEPRGARASAVRIALTRGSVQFRFLPLWVVPLFRSHLSTQQMKPKQLEVHPPVCMGVRLTQAGSATIPPRQRSASPRGKPWGPGLATANTGVDGTGSLRLLARAPYACKDQRGQKMGEAMATQDFDFALPRATRRAGFFCFCHYSETQNRRSCCIWI